MTSPSLLRRYRVVLILFIAGLVLSGVTAFPLLSELRLLDGLTFLPAGVHHWIATVHEGLEVTHRDYPWLAYGTDWLAFGHLIIALFFIGPLIDPIRNRWVLKVGVVACLLVFPLAFIAGPIRGIPFYWRLIDCSFGAFGLVPLLYCLKLGRRLFA